MFANLRWRLLALARKIWVRATLYSLVGVGAALLALAFGPLVPDSLATRLGAGSVETVLTIMASSMLSVTIFALSTMVGAFAGAGNASPRATRLVAEDSTAQSILATFLGVFLFSLVGIIALSTGAYGPGERFVLFLVTLALVAVTVTSLIRWIQHITRLGRLSDSTDRVEQAAIRTFAAHRREPQLGGAAWDRDADPAPSDAVPVLTDRVGYVRHLDVASLAAKLDDDQRVWVLARPGAFVGPNRPLALVGRAAGEPVPEALLASLRAAWSVADTRSFDQDPRFGLCVLAEVASKALSAAVNDVGTAIDVLGRLVRVMTHLEGADDDDASARDPRENVLIAPISALDALQDAFRPIARDGAGAVELGLRLQVTLAHVAKLNARPEVLAGDLARAAAVVAADALARAREALDSAADVAELEASADHLLSRHGLAAVAR